MAYFGQSQVLVSFHVAKLRERLGISSALKKAPTFCF